MKMKNVMYLKVYQVLYKDNVVRIISYENNEICVSGNGRKLNASNNGWRYFKMIACDNGKWKLESEAPGKVKYWNVRSDGELVSWQIKRKI